MQSTTRGMNLKLKQAVLLSVFWASSSIAASVSASSGTFTRASSPLRLAQGFKPSSPAPAAITDIPAFGSVADQAALVHGIIDRARANDGVITVEDTHRFSNYSMRDAMIYIDAFMDKGEAQVGWPEQDGALVKRTCEGADSETCSLPEDTGFCSQLKTNICGAILSNTALMYAGLAIAGVYGATFIPQIYYQRRAATFGAMTAAKLNEQKYYWVVKNGEAVLDGTLPAPGDFSATYDVCAGLEDDEVILITRSLSNSQAEKHVDQIQQGFADVVGNLADCGRSYGIGTFDAHGSWWVEFQIASKGACQNTCGY